MTAIFGTESYELGAVGDAITGGNTQHSFVGAGWTFTDTPAPAVGLGVQSARVEVATAAISYAQASFTATDIAVPRMYVRFPTVPTGSVDIATARSSGSLRARLGIVDGKFVIRNGSTVVWTSTTNVPATSWCRLEWFLNNNTGTQQLRIFRLSNNHGTVADEDSGAVTLTTGAGFDIVREGPAFNALTTSWVAFYDAFVISDVTWPGPGYTGGGGTVTVTASADQLGVEPWSTVTMSASAAGDTVTGWAWSQLQGPTVALTGADTDTVTFEAPAEILGASLQFQATATTATATGQDYVNVTARAVTERAVIGGREVPMRILNAVDPNVVGWNPDSAWQGGTAWGDH